MDDIKSNDNTTNDNTTNDISLFHRAISRLENPSQEGFCITSDQDDKCRLVMRDPISGRPSQYALKKVFADLQFRGGEHWQMGPREIVGKKLCIFMYNAVFGRAIKERVYPEIPGTFEVYSLQDGPSNPILIATSKDKTYGLNLTAIGMTGKETTKLLGLRAVFFSTYPPFGVVRVTTDKEFIDLWYKQILKADRTRLLSTNGIEYDPRPLFNKQRWGDEYAE